MQTLSLNGKWHFSVLGKENWSTANVPGSVYSDLLNIGKMDDPYWRDNELKALEIMNDDFIYRRTFEAAPAFLSSDALLLRCEGLDTICEIKINGKEIANTNNMHRTWEFAIDDKLKAGTNEIEIIFRSPTAFIKEAYKSSVANGVSDAMVGFPLIRKAHCMFGWDWGPRIPDAGIWRDISIVAVDTVRIDSVYVTQKHESGKVTLEFDPEIQVFKADSNIKLEIEVTAPSGKTYKATESTNNVIIDDPLLWWPNGYGDQPLYSVSVTMTCGDKKLDSWTRKIGLRTMKMHIEKDEWGESFAHEINGVQIFAMGADYIPEDNILSRINPERTRRLLEDSAAAHFNVIRIWGGGYYPDDFFYDICDELGLVIWQDFMFSCAVYNLTPEFDENISAELTQNIKRIRHHASLGLWCGNNEMELFVDNNTWVSNKRQKADYIKMYEYIFPNLVKKYDPNTFYWPASPSSGGSFDEPNSPDRGDVHYWEVWHSNKPFFDYRKYFFRYVSEFGFQSFPCKKTIDSFTLPEDRNIFSYVMEKHQRNNAANGKILGYLAQTFLYPNDFETLLYASQLLQAEAIKYGVEHWRRNRGRCMGTVYWQLNDCWPVASWASIDYFGRWKALHYYAKRFFAPLLLSCEEFSTFNINSNINAEVMSEQKTIRFSVSNETMKSFNGSIRWSLRHVNGNVLCQNNISVASKSLTAMYFDTIDISEASLFDCYVYFELLDTNGKVISASSCLLCPPKYFHFPDPQLSYLLKGDKIIVTAKNYAKSIKIDFEDGDVFLSDNYFDMVPGSSEVSILRGSGRNVSIKSVYDIK